MATKSDTTEEKDEYAVPVVDLTPEDEVWLTTVCQTSDQAQQLFLQGKLDEDQLAKAVTRFGKPANPSETKNRADDAFEKKLPKWVFQPPEGSGLTIEQRQAEVDALSTEPTPPTHEQVVMMPPEDQAKAAAEAEKAKEKSTTTSTPPPQKS